MTARSGVFHREVITFLRQQGIALIGGTRQGLGAIDRLARWAEPARALRGGAGKGRAIRALLGGCTRGTINEFDAKRRLAQAGLPVVGERLVASHDDARAAARAIGYPVVLKVVADTIPHRSDLGLVAVGLRDDAELSAEWDRMARRLSDLDERPGFPGALGALGGVGGHVGAPHFVIQEMASGVPEVFAGVKRDPDFGLV